MPDGDKIHSSLGFGYQDSYRRLCEGEIALDAQGRTLCSAIKRDLERGYAKIASALRATSDRLRALDEAMAAGACDEVDRRAEALRARQEAAACGGPKRATELVIRAAHTVLNAPEGALEAAGAEAEVYKEYARCVYEAHFRDAVMTADEHFATTPPEVVEERLEQLSAHIEPQLSEFGLQMWRQRDKDKVALRLQAKPKASKIEDLEEDLLSVMR